MKKKLIFIIVSIIIASVNFLILHNLNLIALLIKYPDFIYNWPNKIIEFLKNSYSFSILKFNGVSFFIIVIYAITLILQIISSFINLFDYNNKIDSIKEAMISNFKMAGITILCWIVFSIGLLILIYVGELGFAILKFIGNLFWLLFIMPYKIGWSFILDDFIIFKNPALLYDFFSDIDGQFMFYLCTSLFTFVFLFMFYLSVLKKVTIYKYKRDIYFFDLLIISENLVKKINNLRWLYTILAIYTFAPVFNLLYPIILTYLNKMPNNSKLPNNLINHSFFYIPFFFGLLTLVVLILAIRKNAKFDRIKLKEELRNEILEELKKNNNKI